MDEEGEGCALPYKCSALDTVNPLNYYIIQQCYLSILVYNNYFTQYFIGEQADVALHHLLMHEGPGCCVHESLTPVESINALCRIKDNVLTIGHQDMGNIKYNIKPAGH